MTSATLSGAIKARAPGRGADLLQTREAFGKESPAPASRLLHGNGQDSRDVQVLLSLGSEENDARPSSNPDLGLATIGPRLQGGSLFTGEFDRRSNARESLAPKL
jgi:hypothetical protein